MEDANRPKDDSDRFEFSMNNPPPITAPNEIDRIRAEYDRRAAAAELNDRYSPLNPSVYLATQERQLQIIRSFNQFLTVPLGEAKILEIGCGMGGNLRELIQLGAKPQKIIGNDLMPDRIETARELLPSGVTLLAGDALELDLQPASFDIVMQSTVFSSILDDGVQSRLAAGMWSLVKPGGGVLWYDFTFNNPRNPNVRGVKLVRIRELFPAGPIHSQTVTLAPPISRRVVHIHPSLYHLFNFFPFLRTHLVCWIGKPASAS